MRQGRPKRGFISKIHEVQRSYPLWLHGVTVAPRALELGESSPNLADEIVNYLENSSAVSRERVRYPGERVLRTRKENLKKGIPVEATISREVQTFV
ncbi:MAG: hypothetical protein ACRD51_17135 [Candidatus Acidiferrum sp.]